MTGWITCDHRLPEADQRKLNELLFHCPELAADSGLARSRAAMMAILSATRLFAWFAAARADSGADLRSFTDGQMADLDAVTRGLGIEWNSDCGVGRGTDCRIMAFSRSRLVMWMRSSLRRYRDEPQAAVSLCARVRMSIPTIRQVSLPL